MVAILYMENFTLQMWKCWFCVQGCLKLFIYKSSCGTLKHLFLRCDIFNFTMNIFKETYKTWMITNIKIFLHVNCVNMQGKFNNLHQNHFAHNGMSIIPSSTRRFLIRIWTLSTFLHYQACWMTKVNEKV